MKLSILIPVKNEQDFIEECLTSCLWADEIIVLLSDTTDKTEEIVKKFKKVIIIKNSGGTFSSRKNKLIKSAHGDWLFFLDADERITPLLKKEILTAINGQEPAEAYAVPRRNFLLGKELQWGGWGSEDSFVIRLFQKSKLKGVEGELHETPIFDGDLKKLLEPLVHFQPDNLEEAFSKTISWTEVEAKLFLAPGINHPPVTWWRVLKMGLVTLFDRFIRKQGFRDGKEGWIESVFQAYHTMIIYLRIWELQQK